MIVRYCGRASRAISSAGERFVHTEEVTGSIPVSPTQSAQVRSPLRRALPCSWLCYSARNSAKVIEHIADELVLVVRTVV
jgi:hypothetical protein